MDLDEGLWFLDGDVLAHAEDPLEDVEKGLVAGGADGETDFESSFLFHDGLSGVKGAVGEEVGHGRADVEPEGDEVGAVGETAEAALYDLFGIEIGVGFEALSSGMRGLNSVELKLPNLIMSVVAGEEIPVALHVEDMVRVDEAFVDFGGAEAVIFDLNGVLVTGGVEENVPDFGSDGQNGRGCEAEDSPIGVVAVHGDMVFEIPGYFVEDIFEGFLHGCAPVLGDGLAGDEEGKEVAFGEDDLGQKPTGFR